MNIIDLQERLKDFPEQALMQEMQAPSGMAPQFLVLSELKRRKRMRDDFQRAQAADMKTVAEEAITGAGVPQAGIMQMAGAMAPNTNVAQDTGINDAMERTPTQAPQPQGIMSMARGGYVKKMQAGRLVGGGAFGTNVEYNYETFLREMNLSDSPDARDAFRRYQDYVNAQRPYRESIQQPTVAAQAPDTPGLMGISADLSAFMPSAEADQPVMPVLARPSGAALDSAVYSPRGVAADFDATQELPVGDGDAARLAEALGVGQQAEFPQADSEGEVFDPTALPAEMEREIARAAAAEAAQQSRVGMGTVDLSAQPMSVGDLEYGGLDVGLEGGRSIMETLGFGPALERIRESEAAAAEAEAARTAEQEAARAAEAARMIGINEIPDRPRQVTEAGEIISDTAPTAPSADAPAAPDGGGVAGGAGGAGGVGGFGPIESRIAQMLQEREQSAAADKWLALAQTGLALMASRQPTLGGAIGEAGLAGIGAMRQARSQYDKDVLGLLEMQAGIQRAKTSGARTSAPKATTPSEINAALDYWSGVRDEQATVVSVNEFGEKVTTKDYSRVSPNVASRIKQLEDQYMALLRGGSVDLNLVQ